jgi:acetyl-CoA C-acetyltransferase
VTANGNYLTKHSAGIYSTERPARPFAPQDPALLQAELDRVPHPHFVPLAEGAARVETYTVTHDGRGPAGAVVIGRLDNGHRFIANTPADPALWAEMQAQDFLDRRGQVSHDGERNVFTPA